MADRLSFTVPSTNTPTAPPIGAQFGEAIVKSVPLAKIKPFPNHPFLVVEDADLRQLADSIRDHGIQEPVMLRPIDKGRYVALTPVFDDAEEIIEDDGELIILKVVEEDDGETYLEPIEDEAEFDEVGNLFEQRIAELYDFDDIVE